jgi:hypothetical protein
MGIPICEEVTMKKNIALLMGLTALGAGLADRAFGSSLTELSRNADVVILARSDSMSVEPTGRIEFQLQPVATLKGDVSSAPLIARLAPSALLVQFAPQRVEQRRLAVRGLWFLKAGLDGVFQVIPTIQMTYTDQQAFWPVPDSWAPPQSASLSAQLYSALRAWYASCKSATMGDDFAYLVNFGTDAPPDWPSALSGVIDSTDLDKRVIGLAAAVRSSSDDALGRIADEIATMRTSSKFIQVPSALTDFYQPHGAASIALLRKLMLLKPDVPGLDFAVVRALGRVSGGSYTPENGPGPAVSAAFGLPSKAVLPFFVELLDSRDEKAQLGAARMLSEFASRANENGEIVQGVSGRLPYRTAETGRYTPTMGSTIPTTEYVSFWKAWWVQNRAGLGFPAP